MEARLSVEGPKQGCPEDIMVLGAALNILARAHGSGPWMPRLRRMIGKKQVLGND